MGKLNQNTVNSQSSVRDQSIDSVSKSQKVLRGNPSHLAYDPGHGVINETNVAAATYRERFSTKDYRDVTAHLECSGGVTMTVWVSNKEDPSTSSDADWIDTGVTVTDSKQVYSSKKDFQGKWVWIMIKYVTSDATNSIEADIMRYN